VEVCFRLLTGKPALLKDFVPTFENHMVAVKKTKEHLEHTNVKNVDAAKIIQYMPLFINQPLPNHKPLKCSNFTDNMANNNCFKEYESTIP
jgi:hypothetical protein